MTKPTAKLADPIVSPTKEFLEDPYPALARLRAEAPVFWSEKGKYWMVSRYDDVSAILRDLQYEKGFARMKVLDPLMRIFPQLADAMKLRGKSMLNQNPPDHTRLRALVNKAFTPTMVSGMRPHIERIANKLIDQIEQKKDVDLISEFAFVLPVTVIAEMLGIPAEDRDKFKVWSHALTEILEPTLEMGRAMKALDANHALLDYLRPLVAERRKNPRTDLISALVQAEEEGSKLTEDELLANTVLLLVAGHETTVNLIGNGMLALLKNQEQMDLLKSQPDMIETAVDEFLRYDSPVQFTRRMAACDMELGGQRIRENDMFILLLGSANRDETQFEEPDRLNIARTNNKHIAFGSGIHHCLGSSLARAEGQIAIGTILQRLPNIHLKGTNIEHKLPYSLRGVKDLPVAF
jgi:cytochrome P450